MLIFILLSTNATEGLKIQVKSEFLVDPGIKRPEFADSFLTRALPISLFQTLIALNTKFCLLTSSFKFDAIS